LEIELLKPSKKPTCLPSAVPTAGHAARRRFSSRRERRKHLCRLFQRLDSISAFVPAARAAMMPPISSAETAELAAGPRELVYLNCSRNRTSFSNIRRMSSSEYMSAHILFTYSVRSIPN
jgi:hypothetical protein